MTTIGTDYTCSACGNTYPRTRSDEEALAEAIGEHGAAIGEDPAIVCDRCWREMSAAPVTAPDPHAPKTLRERIEWRLAAIGVRLFAWYLRQMHDLEVKRSSEIAQGKRRGYADRRQGGP